MSFTPTQLKHFNDIDTLLQNKEWQTEEGLAALSVLIEKQAIPSNVSDSLKTHLQHLLSFLVHQDDDIRRLTNISINLAILSDNNYNFADSFFLAKEEFGKTAANAFRVAILNNHLEVNLRDSELSHLKDRAFKSLCNLIVDSRILSLDLSGNYLGNERKKIIVLFDAITSSSKLKSLNLNINYLSSLAISGEGFRTHSFQSFCSMIKNFNVMFIDLGANELVYLNDDSRQKFFNALENNTSLIKIDIDCGPYERELPESSKEIIRNTINTNKKLFEIRLSEATQEYDELIKKTQNQKFAAEDVSSLITIAQEKLATILSMLPFNSDRLLKIYKHEKNVLQEAIAWHDKHNNMHAAIELLMGISPENSAYTDMHFLAFERAYNAQYYSLLADCILEETGKTFTAIQDIQLAVEQLIKDKHEIPNFRRKAFHDSLIYCLNEKDGGILNFKKEYQEFFDTILGEANGIQVYGKNLSNTRRLALMQTVLMQQMTLNSSSSTSPDPNTFFYLDQTNKPLPFASLSNLTDEKCKQINAAWQQTIEALDKKEKPFADDNDRLVFRAIIDVALTLYPPTKQEMKPSTPGI